MADSQIPCGLNALADGEFHACVKNAASSSGYEVRIIDKLGSPTQRHARAFAFSWSNSA